MHHFTASSGPYHSNNRLLQWSVKVVLYALKDFFFFFSLAIEAMKNAHRTELEKELDRARKTNSNTENADIEEIRRQHE